jgi:hypothetical protein
MVAAGAAAKGDAACRLPLLLPKPPGFSAAFRRGKQLGQPKPLGRRLWRRPFFSKGAASRTPKTSARGRLLRPSAASRFVCFADGGILFSISPEDLLRLYVARR